LIISQFNGCLYRIDSNSNYSYHRGPLYFAQSSVAIAIVVFASVLLIIKRKKIEKKYFISMLFFGVPTIIGIILQIYIYGISFVLSAGVISLVLVFMKIQNTIIYTDYLTGIYNRKKLDMYLKEKISSKYNSFSAIMMDLNNFKNINDKFGHDAGDDVLKITAEILKNSIETEDLVARYGGDEFCIILNHSDSLHLRNAVENINKKIDDYNTNSNKAYKISLSMGFETYNKKSDITVEEFQRIIDKLMYKNKFLEKNKIQQN
jgi:diguanylate cyclase (GGDEF)-like protein